jgi:nitrogen fixation protein FixH
VVAVWYAVGDPALAVVPNYYDKAVRWDELRAVRERSAAMGWQVNLGWTPADPSGERQVTVQLLDANGKPVTVRDLSLECFHHARANEIQQVALTERSEGLFAGAAQLPQPGLYRMTMRAEFAGRPFVWEEDRQLDATATAN